MCSPPNLKESFLSRLRPIIAAFDSVGQNVELMETAGRRSKSHIQKSVSHFPSTAAVKVPLRSLTFYCKVDQWSRVKDYDEAYFIIQYVASISIQGSNFCCLSGAGLWSLCPATFFGFSRGISKCS